jgi:hypothetical protein
MPVHHVTNELLDEVRSAATELVERLQFAERASGGWAHEELSNALVDVAMRNCLKRLSATGCWGEANRMPSGEFWRIAGPLLESGSLHTHARRKPRGYAGDHEMLARICNRAYCDHPLGRALDHFFQSQAAPSAVRSRTELAAALLASRVLQHQGAGFHAVSVGAGPAIDVQRAVQMLPEKHRRRLRVTLVDLDPLALEAARERIEPVLSDGALRCEQANLARLPTSRRAASVLDQPDFLLCLGLFDYLNAEVASALLDLFWRRLAPGGTMLVGNFAQGCPTRAYMEWVGLWYLTYRRADELRDLAATSGLPDNCVSVAAEPLGVNLLLQAQKPEVATACVKHAES